MKKKDVRVLLAAIATTLGIVRVREYFVRQELVVLTFHRVIPEKLLDGYLFQSLAIPENIFDKLMQFLKENYEIVLLDEGIRRLETPGKIKKPLLSITFDDGYTDNYIYAEPILRRHKVLATFFIVTDLIGTDQSLWYDIAARTWVISTLFTLKQAVGNYTNQNIFSTNKKPSFSLWMKFLKSLDNNTRLKIIASLEDPGQDDKRGEIDRIMTVDQIKDIGERGHQIGSHTCTHPLLPQLSKFQLHDELERSKLALETLLQRPVTAFCYPNGDLDVDTVQAVRAAGYLTACTTQEKRNHRNCDKMRINRIDMNPSRLTDSQGNFHAPSFRALIAKT